LEREPDPALVVGTLGEGGGKAATGAGAADGDPFRVDGELAVGRGEPREGGVGVVEGGGEGVLGGEG
jgi:hypothetical protein